MDSFTLDFAMLANTFFILQGMLAGTHFKNYSNNWIYFIIKNIILRDVKLAMQQIENK